MFSVTKVDDKNNSYKYKEFLLDAVDDVAKLPTSKKMGTQEVTKDSDAILNDYCGAGSTAFVIENSSAYILGNDDVWHEI